MVLSVLTSCTQSVQFIWTATSQLLLRMRRRIFIRFFHFLNLKGWWFLWTLNALSLSSQMQIMTHAEKCIAGARIDCKDCLTCDMVLNEKTSICGRGSLLNLQMLCYDGRAKCKNGLCSSPILTRHSIYIKRLMVCYG